MSDTTKSTVTDSLQTVFGLIRENTVSTLVSVIGLSLLALGVYLSYQSVKKKPEEVTPWFKWILFGSLGMGILISLAGATLAVLDLSKDRLRSFSSVQVKSDAVLRNLQNNSEVTWLIRLIPFDPNTKPELSIARLTHLGRSDQTYTFVADYAELRGYSAYDAIHRVGSTMRDATHVSAIIFPIREHHVHVYPANARGILQVIREIESSHQTSSSYTKFDLETSLGEGQKDDLKDTDSLPSWEWKSYSHYYKDYCELAQRFRCGEYSAKSLMGNLSPDWHPLGFAQDSLHPPDPCKTREAVCEVSDWDKDVMPLAPHVGARVFLIENFEIDTLEGRILIDFDDPKSEVIPDLGLTQ
jgi:hypothetical protein